MLTRREVLPRSLQEQQCKGEVGEDEDDNELLDIALGREHVIVQDSFGLWAAGNNKSHQLGIRTVGSGNGMSRKYFSSQSIGCLSDLPPSCMPKLIERIEDSVKTWCPVHLQQKRVTSDGRESIQAGPAVSFFTLDA